MLFYIKFFGILVIVLNSEASPLHDQISLQRINKVKAASDERLPTDVTPSLYNLQLTLTETFMETNNFSGLVKITFSTTSQNTKSFKLHAKDLIISSDDDKNKDIQLEDSNAKLLNITIEEPQSDSDILTINIDAGLVNGTYSLTISYTGHLSPISMEGFYISTYDDDGKEKYLATTQFEEMGARRAFPCFDEPNMKAEFDITILYPKGYNALSNAPVKGSTSIDEGTKLEKVTFQRTPRMSTYLVAFIVSEFTATPGDNITESIPNQVYARKGEENKTAVASATAVKVLEVMADYTGVQYSDMGIDKLDQVAIPDFAAGAMENWGLVTYREADILWDETESSNYYKQVVTTVVAHELSHQWFGDLVTLDWWSDIFLNEGFATYFEYYAAHEVEPNWELTKQFVIEQVQTALLTDSKSTSLPLSYNTTDPNEIEGRFDDISYNKGGSILRMAHHFLGIDNFKSGLKDYIKNKAHQNSKPEDLWTFLGKYVNPNYNLPALNTVMSSWTTKAGYPLLTVSAVGENVTIKQEQFLLEETSETQWYVPITYSVTSGDFENTETQAWLEPNSDLTLVGQLKDKQWIILNNKQIGYYRVNYDDKLWASISTALNKPEFDGIDEISRSQIVDDQLNLARAGKKNYKDVLKFLSFLKNETSYYSWSAAFNGFNYLLKHTSDSRVHTFFKAYILDLMTSLIESVPFGTEKENEQIYTLTHVLSNTWACSLGSESCLADSKKLFETYMNDTTKKPSRNIKSIVYCYGLRNSDNVTAAYEFLWSKYLDTKLATEQVTILKALGCAEDSKIRQKYLEEALNINVRIQDVRYVFSSVYSSDANGVTAVLNFINEKSKEFSKRFGEQSSTLPSLISTVADLITDSTQVNLLTTIAKTDESLKEAVNAGLVVAKNNLSKAKKLETTLKEYFSISDNGASINNFHFTNLAIVLIGYIMFNLY